MYNTNIILILPTLILLLYIMLPFFTTIVFYFQKTAPKYELKQTSIGLMITHISIIPGFVKGCCETMRLEKKEGISVFR